MSDTPSEAVAVVEAYHRAWTTGDVDRALEHVAEESRCSAPGSDVMTKQDWARYLGGFAPRLTGAPEHARMADGDRVALWYFPQTEATTSTLASELFTVRDGQIVEIHLAFDRLGYQPAGQETG
ncbi:MAG: nuclear transport factor 2 family protein [Terracoccus sp.]